MNSAINSQEKTVSALWFKGLLQAATSLQLQQSELLKASGVSEDELAHPYDRLSLQKNQKLWRAIESSSRLANIGLRIGEMVKPSHFQLFAVTLMHCSNLEAAFTKSMRYTRVLSDGGHYFLQKDVELALCYEPADESFSRHQVDAILVLLHSFSSWLACRSIPIVRVEVRHDQPENIEDYKRIFNAPLRFNATRNALIFDPALLEEPLSLGDQSRADMHEQMLEAQLALLQKLDTAALVRHYLRMSDDLEIDREQLAAQLNMSGRSLQRKLKDCQTSFQQLLDEERFERAKQLMQQKDYSLTAISAQLGFSESSVFSRAFRRWSGITPQEYRQSLKTSS